MHQPKFKTGDIVKVKASVRWGRVLGMFNGWQGEVKGYLGEESVDSYALPGNPNWKVAVTLYQDNDSYWFAEEELELIK